VAHRWGFKATPKLPHQQLRAGQVQRSKWCPKHIGFNENRGALVPVCQQVSTRDFRGQTR
ncbi:hypothetical protein NDU88_001485, partial [Pleurodeles waltl]